MPHTRPFHTQVHDLVEKTITMGTMAHKSVRDGVEAFKNLDVERAREVITFNQELNRIDVEIEAKALDLLALHQPMAIDLRTIGACLKIITYLDRIGRYGYDIAHATESLAERGHVRRLVGIPLMCDKALTLLDTSIRGFRDRNADLARTVQPADDDVDALYDQIFRECITYMIEDPRTITQCTQYMMVARHLERVGDNAGKIAEKTIYMVTGERRL